VDCKDLEKLSKVKERNKKYWQQYYLKNKKKLIAKNKKWYEDNKEHAKRMSYEWQKNNKERVMEWKLNNRERNNEQARQRYNKNPKYKERNKKYWEDNKEHLQKLNKEWVAKNKEHIRKYNRERYKVKKEQISKNQKRYYEKNKHIYLTNSVLYHSTKNKNVPLFLKNCPIEKKRLNQIYLLGRIYANADGEKRHVDHMWPLSDGGPHWSGNLQILTATKNLEKGAYSCPKLKKQMKLNLKEAENEYARKRNST